MHKKESLFKRFYDHIRNIKFGADDYEYAIIFGILSSFFVFLKELLTYLVADSSVFVNREDYIWYVIASFLVMIIMLFINIKIIPQKSKTALAFIKAYPYLLVTICITSLHVFSAFIFQAVSFMVIMMILSWVKVYSRLERFVIFIYSAIFFNVLSVLLYGVDNINFITHLEVSLMAVVIGYITSWIHHVIYARQKKSIEELDETNKDISTAITALENTNKALKQSHSITAAMLKLTQEVLRNEELGDVLQLVLDESLELIAHAQAGSILILRENDNMEYMAAKGYRLENLKRVNLKYKDLFQAHFDDPYEPTVIKNLQVFDEIHIGEAKTNEIFVEAVNVAKSCLTCSFKFEDGFFGSINLDNFDSENIFTEQDKYLIKQLATELEIIITIHHLYEAALRPTRYDGLTQAFTRTYCMNLLKNMIEVNHKKFIGIGTIDINQLKAINDQFGHDVGDQYLAYFADSIRNAKIKKNIFGRIGGDEFLLVFSDTNYDECLDEVETIRKYLKENPFKAGSFEGEITFSCGFAMYPSDNKNISELIKLSDRKMYEDKRNQNK